MREQAANSPDTNINDLGFFASLSADYWQQTPATNIDELIANVNRAFEEYDPKKLNRIWLTHGSVMNQILETNGDNNYNIAHLRKRQLERRGTLPRQIELSEAAKEKFLSVTNV